MVEKFGDFGVDKTFIDDVSYVVFALVPGVAVSVIDDDVDVSLLVKYLVDGWVANMVAWLVVIGKVCNAVVENRVAAE